MCLSPFFAMRHRLFTTSPFGVGRLSVTPDMLEHMFEVVDRLGPRLAGCVNGLDPDRVAGRDAAELWAAFDRVERLAAAGKTLLARRLADTHQPDETGTKTAAEALARRGGTSVGAARDALETSTGLHDVPQVEAAMRRGDLFPAPRPPATSAAFARRGPEQRGPGLGAP